MSMRHASLGALLGVLVFLACNRESSNTEIVGPAEPTVEEVGRGPLSPANLTLPFAGTAQSNNVVAFKVTQTGSNGGGWFLVDNASNGASALSGFTNGSGTAVFGDNLGKGRAGHFRIQSPNNSASALDVSTVGTGTAINALATGGGRAGYFRVNKAGTISSALEATTNGFAPAVIGASTGNGGAALFHIASASNNSPAVDIFTHGTGSGLEVDHRGSSGSLAEFQVNGANRIRFTRNGRGIFNGGTQTGGADVAEAFAVEGPVARYEPGDVLVISTRSDRRVEKTGERYSTRVAGVYATKPGVLLTERGIDDGLVGLVPVGVIGVIPTKVSAENGPIRRGDLLVTASRPGHAMRATPVIIQGVTLYPTGAILGRALEEFRGPGTGVITVLINVK